jgi:2-methylcitrate dehydratase PrpD
MPDSDLLPHILDLAAITPARLPQDARKIADLSLFDWMVVSLAGADQPLASIIRDFVVAEGGVAKAAVTGCKHRLPARAAALANGTISHALDYDDTHFAYIGHPSVAIFPAALAAAEEMGASGDDVVDAFLVGAEAACRIGIVLGRDHYNAGFHQTATSGAFGATIAAARLYQLDRTAISMALGLVSTRASGLKSQFGTMGKPFNAGAAAANGIEAASLAKRGFSASLDAFAGPQSFLAAHHADQVGSDEIVNWSFDKFFFTTVSHKLHACCHLTHAMIEALLLLKAAGKIAADDIDEVHVHITPAWQNVCDIKTPKTGLEIKFSYVFLAAMVLQNINLAADESYHDAACEDASLIALADRVKVVGDDRIADSAARVEVRCKDGQTHSQSFDLLSPIDPAVLGPRLLAKGEALIGEAAYDLWEMTNNLRGVSAADLASKLQS